MQSALQQKKCIPCKGQSPLSATEIKEMLSQTPGWELINDGKAIHSRFKFKNFVEALNFVNKIGEIAEQEQHHPDFTLGWGYVECTLWTHDVGGLHSNDFIMASKINALPYKG